MQGAPGRQAADIIETARKRQVPVLTLREAARRAGISDEGWSKVIRRGRGREQTVIAMARVVGAEAEVRAALGLPSVDDPGPLPDMSADERREVIEMIYKRRADAGRREA